MEVKLKKVGEFTLNILGFLFMPSLFWWMISSLDSKINFFTRFAEEDQLMLYAIGHSFFFFGVAMGLGFLFRMPLKVLSKNILAVFYVVSMYFLFPFHQILLFGAF